MGETLTIMSVVSFLLAGVLGMAAVVLWLQFDIPQIMGEQRDRPAKRSAKGKSGSGGRMAEDVTEQLEEIMIIHTDEVLGEGEETE